MMVYESCNVYFVKNRRPHRSVNMAHNYLKTTQDLFKVFDDCSQIFYNDDKEDIKKISGDTNNIEEGEVIFII